MLLTEARAIEILQQTVLISFIITFSVFCLIKVVREMIETLIEDKKERKRNVVTGKEILIKYCQEHSGEEIYNLLRRLFDDSMSWTDSRMFIVDWLNGEEVNEGRG